jgi:hypothetical protein
MSDVFNKVEFEREYALARGGDFVSPVGTFDDGVSIAVFRRKADGKRLVAVRVAIEGETLQILIPDDRASILASVIDEAAEIAGGGN